MVLLRICTYLLAALSFWGYCYRRSELFQTSPDSGRLMSLATEVFTHLQNAVDLGGDTLEYKALLADVNNFLQLLDDYSTITEAGAGTSIQKRINGLADGSLLSLEEGIDNLLWRKQFRYLTNHNAAQKGLICLISPYREVAVFSLFLALLLDISAFITGVIIDKVESIYCLRELLMARRTGFMRTVPFIMKTSCKR